MAKKSSGAVEIKGYGNDVNIILNDEADFSDVESELVKRLEDSEQFFSGVSVVLDAGKRVLGAEECEKLREILSERFNLIISAVKSESGETQEMAEKLGWKSEAPQVKKQKVQNRPVGRKNDTILLKGTLRSGQREWHTGNIVVIGDVNPGAEVVATGDVVIFGNLRGVAHAGADGDTSAAIIALNLHPIQLRIAGYIGRSPDLKPKSSTDPEIAQVEDGNIVIHKLK